MQQNYLTSNAHAAPDRFKTAQVYGRLKSLLVFQNVPPQSKLDIGMLARRLGVSKTPVREALILLASEGIILNIPGNGYYSKPLSEAEMAEDYDLALTILKHLIEIDVSSSIKMELPLLQTGTLAMLGTDMPHNARPYADFIEALYESLAKMSGNRKYFPVVHSFIGRTTFIRQLDLQRPDRFVKISVAMTEFVDCLVRHDAKGAIDNLERQYKEKADLLHELVQEGNLHALNATDNWEFSSR